VGLGRLMQQRTHFGAALVHPDALPLMGCNSIRP
jgi:hypothetical protein